MISNRVLFSVLTIAAGALALDRAAVVLFGSEVPVQPNVVLILADDLGFGDLSCYGNRKIQTPVLDQMAGEGVRLTSFYAGCTVCTPSRMALLTGRYPLRWGWRGGVIGHRIPPVNGLSPQALTMAEVFKKSGYVTSISGKWHLGDSKGMLPMGQGFDASFYITKSNNQTKKIFRDGKLVADPFNNRLLTEQFTNEAIHFIRSNHTKPFFLYLPYTAPHFPAQAHPDWKGKSPLGAYGDVVEELDSRIGMIMKTLSEVNLDEKTIVIFMSDNGPEPGQKKWAQASPFRGLKWSSLEGGNRVPCFVRFPGVIPSGQVNNDLTAAIDILPTLSLACGIDLSKFPAANLPAMDGISVWDTWIKKTDSLHARSELLFWHGWGTLQAIRVGQWKLYVDKVDEISGSEHGPVLINLADDFSETKNLSEQFPFRVKTMKELAIKRLAEIEADRIPIGGPKSDIDFSGRRSKWLE